MNERYLECVKSNNDELFNNEYFSDFKIKIQGDEILCHKCILYSGSEFFKAFFNFNQNQSDISLNDGIVTFNGIKNCLIYIYAIGHDFILSEEICEETYIAADFLQINALKSLASKSISGNINLLNVFGIIQFSLTYHDISLKENARNFINNNFNKISLDNKDFLSLPFDMLSEIVSDRHLSSTEHQILKTILKWTDYDLENRTHLIVQNIFKLVQLHLISSDQWNALSKEGPCRALVDHIKALPRHNNIYNDDPHRIGTPIVLYGVGSRSSDTLNRSNNFFCLDRSMDILAHMTEDRTNHKVCASSTFIFVIGGESTEGFILKSCERYNLVEKKWEPMAELDCHRSNFTVASLEGFVYLFGGNIVTDGTSDCAPSMDVLVYDSGSDVWRRDPWTTPCVLLDAVSVGHNGLIFVVGGLNGSNWPVKRIFEFDPASGDWTPLSTDGLPDDLFSSNNIKCISVAAGGASSDSEGFLLVAGRVRGCSAVYVYHFSINRWRLSFTGDEVPLDFVTYKRTTICCARDVIALLCPATTAMLDQMRLHEPPSDTIDDELLLYVKWQIHDNDWSGELDLINGVLSTPIYLRPGYQFLLSPLVPN